MRLVDFKEEDYLSFWKGCRIVVFVEKKSNLPISFLGRDEKRNRPKETQANSPWRTEGRPSPLWVIALSA